MTNTIAEREAMKGIVEDIAGYCNLPERREKELAEMIAALFDAVERASLFTHADLPGVLRAFRAPASSGA